MDELGDFTISATCSYCGADLAFEASGPLEISSAGGSLNLVVEWDHICLMPPPLISSTIEDGDDEDE